MKGSNENLHNSVKADLHLHTTASDGLLEPDKLVDLAVQSRLNVIAITDHDTTDGILTAIEAARKIKTICVIPGVEINTDVPRMEVHVLGYFIDFKNKELLRNLKELRDSREVRAIQMLKKLDKLGMKIEWERLKCIAKDSPIGRPHVAQGLLEAGYVQSFQDAFDKYIGRNGPAYVEHKKMTPFEVVKLIRDSSGIPVLAHPDNISGLENMLTELKPIGLAGIETYYNGYTTEVIKELLKLAKLHDLIPTGGSDYHGFKDKSETMLGDIKLPTESVRRLFSLAERCNPNLLSEYKLSLAV